MRTIVTSLVAIAALAWTDVAGAGDLKDEVKVEVQGTYVCAGGHLHVKGTVQNLAAVPVGQVKVSGKALDAQGKVLGTATAATKQPVLEFLNITGPLLDQVKSQELAVVAVPAKP